MLSRLLSVSSANYLSPGLPDSVRRLRHLPSAGHHFGQINGKTLHSPGKVIRIRTKRAAEGRSISVRRQQHAESLTEGHAPYMGRARFRHATQTLDLKSIRCNKKSKAEIFHRPLREMRPVRLPEAAASGRQTYESSLCYSGVNDEEGNSTNKNEFALLNARCLPPNDVVALDNRGHPAQIAGVIRLAIDAHYSAMSPHKNFRSASNLRGQSQSEINFGPGRKLSFHDEINPSRGNVASMSALRPWFPVEWCTNIHRKGQIVPSSRTTLCHPHWSSPEDSEAHPRPALDTGAIPVPKGGLVPHCSIHCHSFRIAPKENAALGGWGAAERGKRPCKTRNQTNRVYFFQTAGNAQVYRAV
jgi:hypothetical protein